MTRTSRHEGFASFDAMLSILPLLMMLLLAMDCSRIISGRAHEAMEREALFRKLASAADYTVKSGAAIRLDGKRHPNWIGAESLGEEYSSRLAARLGLESLYVGLKEPDSGYGMCIYRLVAVGESKDVARLFVCGG